jgi:hypothetical protein
VRDTYTIYVSSDQRLSTHIARRAINHGAVLDIDGIRSCPKTLLRGKEVRLRLYTLLCTKVMKRKFSRKANGVLRKCVRVMQLRSIDALFCLKMHMPAALVLEQWRCMFIVIDTPRHSLCASSVPRLSGNK